MIQLVDDGYHIVRLSGPVNNPTGLVANKLTSYITFELHDLRFSSISFQEILTKLWFGSLDENVVRGLVLNI